MRRWQKRLISAVILAVLLTYAVVVASGHHHWPIAANSAMWSVTLPDEFECELPYGVPTDDSQDAFRATGRHIQLSTLQTSFLLGKLIRFPHRSPRYDEVVAGCPRGDLEARRACASDRLVREALEYLKTKYDMVRNEGIHDGPPLRGFRVYRVRYRRIPPRQYTLLSEELVGEFDATSSKEDAD